MATYWSCKKSLSLLVDEGQSEYVHGRGFIVIKPPVWVNFHHNGYRTDDPQVIAMLEKKLQPGVLTRTDEEEHFERPLDEREWLTHKQAIAMGLSPGKLKALVEAGKVKTAERDGKRYYSQYDLTEVLMADAGQFTDRGE